MSICLPAFMDSPQVHTGKGGAALVFPAGVGGTTQRHTLRAGHRHSLSGLTIQRNKPPIEPQVPHTACANEEKQNKV